MGFHTSDSHEEKRVGDTQEIRTCSQAGEGPLPFPQGWGVGPPSFPLIRKLIILGLKPMWIGQVRHVYVSYQIPFVCLTKLMNYGGRETHLRGRPTTLIA